MNFEAPPMLRYPSFHAPLRKENALPVIILRRLYISEMLTSHQWARWSIEQQADSPKPTLVLPTGQGGGPTEKHRILTER